MKIFDAVVAWLVLVLGCIHCAFTHAAYPKFSLGLLWFVSAGMLMILLAAVNLLRIRYAAVAPGLRVICIISNLVLLAWAVSFAFALPVTKEPQVIVSIVLIALLAIFSIVRRPGRA